LAENVCAHWREFDRLYLLAVLRGNLCQAIAELTGKFKRWGKSATAQSILDCCVLAMPFGGIVPARMSPEVAHAALEIVVEEWSRGNAG
jgi:hypothetical protein